MLAVAGVGVSGYLVGTHLADQPIACGGIGQCDYVNSSDYAYIGPVPVAFLGLALYAALLATAVFWALNAADDARLIVYWGLALAGAGFAAYLTYIELAVLKAICVWCVVSAVILAASLLLASLALFVFPVVSEREEADQPRSRRRPASAGPGAASRDRLRSRSP